ncbi:MAG TPA: aminomethyl-transferring glycine dehydrogenase subunit GcvPA [Candidatus Dormibacteraeota bacterium]|nr:aminomethyl-transferring glycine dehydrogenase subunit GcvPA [Candidatus Dormibacteraeota bacterium]
MPYLVHSPEDRVAMLDAIGADSMAPLLADIPATLRLPKLNLPQGLSEPEAMARIRSLAGRNRVFEDRLTFRGGGVYRRFIPAAVPAVTSKGEFYTAYTPYQPEASQGWLQAIFEFQTMIAQLTAMDVANASLYDGATAVAEAAMMAVVHTGRDKVLVAGYLHPEYEETLRGFAKGRRFHVLHHSPGDGVMTAQELEKELHDGVAAVIFQQPNFLGLVEDAAALTEAAHAHGALAIAAVDPISLALLAAPGDYGADIAVGEGQQLGLAPSYGGPHVGFMACRTELVRRLPGRLVGQAFDDRGRRGFVLTLQAREQHIRREKATSNICTNHALCALAATVYLGYMGPDGLRSIARTSLSRAHHLAGRLAELPGFEPVFPDASYLSEFPIRVSEPDALLGRLASKGILGGLDAGRWFPELAGVVLFCCTELNDPAAIDQLVEACR